MRMLLAGLWARRGLNAAALLMTVVALAAAVLGPMYSRASAEHLVDSRVAAQPHYATGLSIALPGLASSDEDGVDTYDPLPPATVLDQASAVMAGPGVGRFWGPERRWLRDTGHTLGFNGFRFMVPLYWRDGVCELASVDGRCPRATGEALVQETMAETMGVTVGETVELSYEELGLVTRRGPDGKEVSEQNIPRVADFEVVGTYRIADATSAAWFDDSRFTGYEALDPAQPSGTRTAADFAAPALLVSPGSMTSQTFVGGVDRLVDTDAVDLGTVPAARRALDGFVARAIDSRAVNPAQDSQLATIFEDVQRERDLLGRVMVAALAPLVVLALLLLSALVAAGAAARRQHVALAKLRGHTPGQVFRFAVTEPFLVVALAAPLALGLAVSAAHVVARVWFTPGIPVAVDSTAWVSLAVVTVAALGASVVAAVDVLREPLWRALANAVARRGTSRASLVLRAGVVAVALAVVLQLLTSADQSAQLLALLAPMLIALAVAVGGGALLRRLSAGWVRRSAGSGSTPAYLAARRLARRPDLANLMVPLLLAVAVMTFAGSATAVSDDWRQSRARAEVGAARSFGTEVSPGRLLAVTRDVDPEGRHLAAVAVEKDGDGTARRLLVDSPRLAAVASWHPSWSDEPPATLAARLSPDADRLAFAGDEVSVTVRDVALESGTDAEASLWLHYVDSDGEQRSAELGRLRNGAGETTLTGAVRECAERCLVEKLFLSGESLSVLDVDGTVTFAEVAVDGREADWGLGEEGAWRPARPFPVSLIDPPLVLTATGDGLAAEVYLGQLPPGEGAQSAMVSGFAAITPSSTPEVQPVVVTRATSVPGVPAGGSAVAVDYPDDVVVGTALNGQPVPMRVVAEVDALPLVGAVGTMADLETSLVEFEPPGGALVLPQLWVSAGTPASMLEEVRDAGVALTPTGDLAARTAELRGDAFSLGLRLFLVVGVATLLIAIFGVFASAVLQSRWRAYEVAALRVVGVPRRSLVRASVLEYVVMLGVAVVLGLASALVSVRLVLPSMSLGAADEATPPPDYGTHWVVVAAVGAVVFLVATAIALVVARRTTRLGAPATLRWAEQA